MTGLESVAASDIRFFVYVRNADRWNAGALRSDAAIYPCLFYGGGAELFIGQ